MSVIHIEENETFITTGGLYLRPLPEPLASLERWCSSRPGMNHGSARATTLAIAATLTSGKTRIKAPPVNLIDETPEYPECWVRPIRLYVAIHENSPAMRVLGPIACVPTVAASDEILWVPETAPTSPAQETVLPADLSTWCAALRDRESCSTVWMDDSDGAWSTARDALENWGRLAHHGETCWNVGFGLLMNLAGTIAAFVNPDSPVINGDLMVTCRKMVEYSVRYERVRGREDDRLMSELGKVVPFPSRNP